MLYYMIYIWARQLWWHRSMAVVTAKRSYPTSKVRGGGWEELPHVQGKRNPSKMVGAERRHQRAAAAAAAKSLQSCPTLCDLIDGSPPGSPVPGILQTRTLEWVAIAFSSAWKWKVKGKSLSCVWLFMTPRTAAHQAPPSMGFSRQEYWSGVPSPSPHQRADRLKPQSQTTSQSDHMDHSLV